VSNVCRRADGGPARSGIQERSRSANRNQSAAAAMPATTMTATNSFVTCQTIGTRTAIDWDAAKTQLACRAVFDLYVRAMPNQNASAIAASA
jgi:hypothetical protein